MQAFVRSQSFSEQVVTGSHSFPLPVIDCTDGNEYTDIDNETFIQPLTFARMIIIELARLLYLNLYISRLSLGTRARLSAR